MNKKIIVYLLGWIMNMEAIFMLLPCVVAAIYRESSGICSWPSWRYAERPVFF